MKSFKEFLSESINISGNASVGTIIVGGTPQQAESVGENFLADVLFQGSIHRLSLMSRNGIPSNQELTEHLQDQYPGAIVQTIYSVSQDNSPYTVTDSKRYHPSKLDWV